MKAAGRTTRAASSTGSQRPVVGVGAVVFVGHAIVLVRRKYPPLAGKWSLPGGHVERGETLTRAVRREVLEETGLRVRVGPIAAVVDRIHRDASGAVAHHYVLVDYLCFATGSPRAASDAADVVLVAPSRLASYGIAAPTRRVILDAVAQRAAISVAPAYRRSVSAEARSRSVSAAGFTLSNDHSTSRHRP